MLSSSLNGTLGLPLELLDKILIEVLGQLSLSWRSNNFELLRPITIIDTEPFLLGEWRKRIIDYRHIAPVCRVWRDLADMHYFAYFKAPGVRYEPWEDVMAHYRRISPYIHRLNVSFSFREHYQRPEHMRRLLEILEVACAVSTPPSPSIPPITQVNTLRGLSQLVLTCPPVEGFLPQAILESICQLETLEALGIRWMDFFQLGGSPSTAQMPTRLATLDIAFTSRDFADSPAHVPFYGAFGGILRTIKLQNLRLAFVPTDPYRTHDHLADALIAFKEHVIHVDVEVDDRTQGMDDTIPYHPISLSLLRHLEFTFPVHRHTLSRFVTSSQIETITINGMNTLWDWEETAEGNRPIRGTEVVEALFASMLEIFCDGHAHTLRLVVLGDLYKHPQAPMTLAFQKEFEGIIDNWIPRFEAEGVDLLARKSRFYATEQLRPFVNRLVAEWSRPKVFEVKDGEQSLRSTQSTGT